VIAGLAENGVTQGGAQGGGRPKGWSRSSANARASRGIVDDAGVQPRERVLLSCLMISKSFIDTSKNKLGRLREEDRRRWRREDLLRRWRWPIRIAAGFGLLLFMSAVGIISYLLTTLLFKAATH
jgi:hypothetical protein